MRRIPCTMKRVLTHEREALGGPTTSSLFLNDLLKFQDVTLEGVDVTLRVSFVHFLKLKSNYFVKGKIKGVGTLILWFTLILCGQTIFESLV
jgi:hypothetical protein